MTELDADILAAFAALDATVPEGYFDDFETRLQARIEETAMTDISDPTAASADDQELADIRALAAKTRARVSQRMSAVKSSDEPLISSVSLALKTISLPEPGKDFKFFAIDDTPKASAAAAVAGDERDGGLPVWIYAAISAVAAAAVMFFFLRGGDNQTDTGTQVASNDTMPAEALSPVTTTPGALQGGSVIPGQNTGSSESGLPADLSGDPAIARAMGASGDGADDDALDGTMAVPEDSGADKSTDDASSARTEAARSASSSADSKKTSRKRKEEGAKSADEEDGKPAEVKASGSEKKKKKKPDTLEDLLTEASGVQDKKDGDAAKKAADKPAAPTRVEIDSSEVRKAMGNLSSKTRACYEKYQQIGMVRIKFGVAQSGQVTSAAAVGTFKGTDTGQCVADAVKSVKFEPFSGAPMTFTWPFSLTQ